MKTTFTPSTLILLCSLSLTAYTQEFEMPSFENDAEHPCISESEYRTLEKRCNENIKKLKLYPNQDKLSTVLLFWPVQAAASGISDCSVYHVAAYVDQNNAAGAIQDFSCGNNTYDGHHGTDISSWPYNFYKMDNNLVEVVAAAAGTIIDKHDGEFDRNCSGNNLTANYIIIQHTDGSHAMYWHMKSNSLTPKSIGENVAAGEFLGIVGSSGSSSGPHLHFEVWDGNTVANRIDPFGGNCNSLNAGSWWNVQKPAKETGIMKVSVNTTDVLMPGCPATETSNESTSYSIPFQGAGLPAGYAKFYIFIRDEIAGMTADCKILNPNGSTYLSWTYTSASDSKTRYWGWSKVLPVNPGTYTFQATYNGSTCSSTFDILGQAGLESPGNEAGSTIYPNPFEDELTIQDSGKENSTAKLLDVNGRTVLIRELDSAHETITELGTLLPGIYFLEIKSTETTVSYKLIKK